MTPEEGSPQILGKGQSGQVLDEILVGVREDVSTRQAEVPLERVKELAAAAPPPLDAYAALRAPGVGEHTETDWTVERDGVRVRVRWGQGDEPMDPVTQVTNAVVTIDVCGPWGEQRIEETMAQRFWTRDELRAAARLAGLEVTAQYGDFDGGAIDAERAWRMISVLRPGG